MQTEFKYIRFNSIEVPESRKTKVFHCMNIKSNAYLGTVSFYPSWRQYCFFPSIESTTIFSSGCLLDIQNFLNCINDEWKKK